MSGKASQIPAIHPASKLLLLLLCLFLLLLVSALFINHQEALAKDPRSSFEPSDEFGQWIARAPNATLIVSRNVSQPELASSPTPKGTIPNIPRQHNYGLVAGGVIILAVILFGLLRYARKH